MDILLFFKVESIIGQYIIYLIALLFSIGIIYTLKEFHYIWSEKQSFTILKNNYETEETIDEVRKNSETINSIDKKYDVLSCLLNNINKSSFSYKRVYQMYESIINHQIFKEHLLDIFSLRSSIPKFISSILIMLGLVGTVLGLVISVKEIQPMIWGLENISDFSTVTNMMFSTLSGMETAFSTTIAGLIGTILLSFFIFCLNKYLNHFITEFESFCIEKLSPLFNLIEEEDKMQSWFSRMEKLIKTLVNSNEKVEHASGRFLIATLKMEEFSSHFKEGAESIVDFRKDVKDLIDMMGSSAKTMDTMITEVIGHNKEISTNLKDAIDKVSQNTAESLKILDKSSLVFDNMSKQIVINEQNMENAIKHLESILEDTKNNFVEYNDKRTEEYSNTLNNVGNNFIKNVGDIIEDYRSKSHYLSEKEDEMVGTIVEHLALLNTYLSDIGADESKKINLLTNIIESANQDTPERLEALERINNTLDKILLSLNGQQ